MNIFNELKDIKRLVYHHHYNLNRKKIKIVMVVGIKNESCVCMYVFIYPQFLIYIGVYIFHKKELVYDVNIIS